MKKIVVIYKSVYGHTKKYADWIAKRFGADLFEASQIRVDKMLEYDVVVYGGGLYASGINGISLITKNFDKLSGKRLIVFTVGLASTDDAALFKPIIDKNFTQEMKDIIKFFHLRGGIDYKRLNILHKPMMAMLKAMISKTKPEDMNDENKAFLDTYGKAVDFTDEKTIAPIIDCIQSF